MRNKIEFRVLTSLYKREYMPLGTFEDMPLPVAGSIVNVNGNPFIVYEASWVYYDNSPAYGYVYVFKAGNYKLKIGNKNC